MEKTKSFETLIQNLTDFNTKQIGGLLIKGEILNSFENDFDNYENEVLINSNSINDKLRFEKILAKLQSLFSDCFINYQLEYNLLMNNEIANYLSYEQYFNEIDTHLKTENFNIQSVLSLSLNITKQKAHGRFNVIYSPIISLHSSPLTGNSLKLCYVLNFLNIVSHSEMYQRNYSSRNNEVMDALSLKRAESNQKKKYDYENLILRFSTIESFEEKLSFFHKENLRLDTNVSEKNGVLKLEPKSSEEIKLFNESFLKEFQNSPIPIYDSKGLPFKTFDSLKTNFISNYEQNENPEEYRQLIIDELKGKIAQPLISEYFNKEYENIVKKEKLNLSVIPFNINTHSITLTLNPYAEFLHFLESNMNELPFRVKHPFEYLLSESTLLDFRFMHNQLVDYRGDYCKDIKPEYGGKTYNYHLKHYLSKAIEEIRKSTFEEKEKKKHLFLDVLDIYNSIAECFEIENEANFYQEIINVIQIKDSIPILYKESMYLKRINAKQNISDHWHFFHTDVFNHLKREFGLLKATQQPQPKHHNLKKEPTDPVKAIFIYCILKSGLMQQKTRVNNEKYCFEVMKKFSINSLTQKGKPKIKIAKEFNFIKDNNKVKLTKHYNDFKEYEPVLSKSLDPNTWKLVRTEFNKLST